MNIKKIILLEIKKKLYLREQIILWIYKKFTFKIYNMGFSDGFNYQQSKGCNKAEKIKIK